MFGRKGVDKQEALLEVVEKATDVDVGFWLIDWLIIRLIVLQSAGRMLATLLSHSDDKSIKPLISFLRNELNNLDEEGIEGVTAEDVNVGLIDWLIDWFIWLQVWKHAEGDLYDTSVIEERFVWVTVCGDQKIYF